MLLLLLLLPTITLIEARLLTVALVILTVVLRICPAVLLLLLIVELPILLVLTIASILLILLPRLKRLGTRLESARIWSEAGGLAALAVDI